MIEIYNILYYCSVCLHIFNLGHQGLVNQLNTTCSTCIDSLLKEPEMICNMDSFGKFTVEGEIQFSDPLLRKTIQEKIEDAYEVGHVNFLNQPFLSGGLDGEYLAWIEMRRGFIINLRELYVYENEVKEVFEKQKQETFQKIDQKAEDVIKERADQMVAKELDPERREKKIEKTIEIVRTKQQEAKNSVESLAISESSKAMFHYSDVILDAYRRLEDLKANEYRMFSDVSKLTFYSLEILRLNVALKKIPNEFPGFEEILLKFNNSLENYQKNKFYFYSD